MESSRPRLWEYQRPTSADKELQFNNALRFIRSYCSRISEPIALLNHVGTIPYVSSRKQLSEREAGLAEYLLNEPPPPNEWIWGRTILAEIVSQELVYATMLGQLNASQMFVDLVPTSIDASSPFGQPPYKKGVDIFMMQLSSYRGRMVLFPVCGIDVTLGSDELVKDKRQRRPGMQSATATPAVVLPLPPLTYDGKKLHSFAKYLDDVARPVILKTGSYPPFYGLTEKEASIWRGIIREEMGKAIDHCRSGLADKERHPGLGDYPYIDEIIRKLEMTESIVRGIPVPARL